jgi:hypothetical protein
MQEKGQGAGQAHVRSRKCDCKREWHCKLLELRVLGEVLARTRNWAIAQLGPNVSEFSMVGCRFETLRDVAVPFANCVAARSARFRLAICANCLLQTNRGR